MTATPGTYAARGWRLPRWLRWPRWPLGLAAVAAAVLLVVYWHVVVSFLLAAVALRLLWLFHTRGRRRGGSLARLVEAGALVSGARSLRRGYASRRVEERRAELHAAKLETEQARAAELRSRVERRERTREEQERAERRAYIRGVADGEGFQAR